MKNLFYSLIFGVIIFFIIRYINNFALNLINIQGLNFYFLILFPLFGAIISSLSLHSILKEDNFYRIRKILFIGFSVIVIVIIDALLISVVGTIIEPQNIRIIDGKPYLPSGEIFHRPPPCPIAASNVVPIYLVINRMVYPTTEALLYFIFFLWFIPALIFGRAWCSWLCPFGGIDELFSSLKKKARLSLEDLPRSWLLFKSLFFISLIMIGIVMGSAFFCEWVCPIQIVYSPPALHNLKGIIKFFILFTLASSFIIILPLLTKKRFFCSYFCPQGGINGIVGALSPFRIKKDEKCNNCKTCDNECPLMVNFNKSGSKGNIFISCSFCGKCINSCPQNALSLKYYKTFILLALIFLTILIIFTSSIFPAMVKATF